MLALIFAFGGFENALLSMGEARQPRRDVPLALGLGLGSVAAVYMAAHLAVVAALPDLASSARPVADAARALGGAGAAAFVSVGRRPLHRRHPDQRDDEHPAADVRARPRR